MLLTVFVLGVLGYFTWGLVARPPSPLCGVYRQPGKFYWLKRSLVLLWIILWRWRRQSHKKKLTFSSPETGSKLEEMDAPQPLFNHPKALDAVCFTGVTTDGTSIVCRVGRRPGRQAEVWLVVCVPGVGPLCHPTHPDTTVYNTDGTTFTAGRLRLEVTEPMRTWRVSYCGPLRKGLCDRFHKSDGEFVRVKFSFVWQSVCDPFVLAEDISVWSLSDAIAREEWSMSFWDRLNRYNFSHYEQWGEMRGKLEVGGHQQVEQTIRLKTLHRHTYGVFDWTMFHRYLMHTIFLETGMTIQYGVISVPDTLSHLMFGYVTYASGERIPVTGGTIDLGEVGENTDPSDSYTFSLTADGKNYLVEAQGQITPLWYHGENRGSKVAGKFATFRVNNVKGYGMAEFCYRNPSGPPITSPEVSVPLVTDVDNDVIQGRQSALFLPFSERACCSPLLVGGKGAQLAQLTSLQGKLDIRVPQGFCVTTLAYQQQIKNFPELNDLLMKLQSYGSDISSDKLKSTCQEIGDHFKKCEITSDIKDAVTRGVTLLWGKEPGNVRLAVRSSASGEDGNESSTAGQLDTYLGLKGIQQVLESVVKCWASGYTYQAVQYRRQQGQQVGVAVGVVIQEMVAADLSGVLFTKDPVTDDPSHMIINANYGLGESVVSGLSDCDTVRLSRAWDDHLSVSEKVIGQKSTVMKMSESGGIESVHSHMTDSCLPDETSLRIGRIGIELEKYYGSARDVEWAIQGGQLYLLQSRPVTSEDTETEAELVHEFDSPLISDRVWLTTGNIGEMMPGAVTPLTLSVFGRAIDECLQTMQEDHVMCPMSNSAVKSIKVYGNHLLINLHHIHQMCVNVSASSKEMLQLSLLGETVPELNGASLWEYMRCQGKLVRLWNSLSVIKVGRTAKPRYEACLKRLASAGQNQLDGCSATDIYRKVSANLEQNVEVWMQSMLNSGLSATWTLVMISVLNGGKTEVKPEHISDIAKLLSNCSDVISVDVPHLLQILASEIIAAGSRELFVSKPVEEAVCWLQSPESGDLGKRFGEFLESHGHRCIREAELLEQSWAREPSKLVKILQSMVKTTAKLREIQTRRDDDDIFRGLSTPVSWIGRKILRWLLPTARAAVGMRETSKSLAVKVVDKLKGMYWSLGEAMVKEGRLPDKELLFFLTHHEIGKLLEKRSPRLINKAIRRRRVFPQQMALQYPKYSVGHAEPIPDVKEEEFVITSVSLKGMPVSQGEVTGRACIMRSLEDSAALQAGDVLIVPYTDVGWSPYFPLIGGLVTEIGGLLSHGAVVAREYGLPCVVNIPRATSIFKTGDKVHLNGSKGTIEKLE